MGGGEGIADVRVGLANRGLSPATSLSIEGELFGHRETRRLDDGIAPGQSRSVLFSFPLEAATPGSHAVTLRLEYRAAGSGGVEQTLLQPAYVLLALGENTAPAVRITAPEAAMDSVGRWRVGLESNDGTSHRVRLRTVLGRNLRVAPAEVLVDVPKSGHTEQELLLFRVDAPWSTAQGALLVAATEGEPLTRTSVVTAVVRVGPDPARMPRLRRALMVVMILLFLAAAVAEFRRWRMAG